MAEKGILPPRRRARTGCQTCRGRRRKCDEGKPRCGYCTSKNLHCEYGPKFSFVEPKARPNKVARAKSLTPCGSTEIQVDASTRTIDQSDFAESVVEAYIQGTIADFPSLDPQHEPPLHQVYIENHNHWPDDGSAGYEQVVPHADINLGGSDNQNKADFGHVLSDGTDQEESTDIYETTQSGNILYASPVNERSQLFRDEPTRSPKESTKLREQASKNVGLLLTYRYQIAPLLDLGVGDQFYGVQCLLRARASQTILDTILNLAKLYEASANLRSHQIQQDQDLPDLFLPIRMADQEPDEVESTALVLNTWSAVLRQPPRLWHRAVASLSSLNFALEGQHQLLLARFALAARLMTPSDDDCAPYLVEFLQHPSPIELDISHSHLRQSMFLLERSLRFMPENRRHRASDAGPLVSAWRTCWQQLQTWFEARSEEMIEVVSISPHSLPRTQWQDNADTPLMLFTNACAMVANVTFHLTATLMLQNKPRLITLSTAHNTHMASATWHVQRVVGITSMAGDNEVCEPIVVAALLHAAKCLSHRNQISMVADLLRRAVKASGLQLESEIADLKRLSECDMLDAHA